MKNALLLIIGLLLLAASSFAQVAINTSGETAATSAILDVSSSSKGILIPRLLTNERTVIGSPENGLMVYDIDTDSFWYYDSANSGWTEIIASVSNNLDGLTDGKSDVTTLFLGNNAGLNDGGISQNTGIGIYSMQNNTTGTHNTATGFVSLRYNTSGNSNSAFGTNSLHRNTTGSNNTALGAFSLHSNTTGFSNVAIGSSALYSNTSSAGNSAIGVYSLRNNQGSYNTGIGAYANYYNETGNLNTIIGYEAGKGTTYHNKSGNVFLGYKAGYNEIGDNKLYIENSNSDTPLIGGDFENDSLFFNGVVRITGGSPDADKILTSDEDGNATWETPQWGATDINGLSDGKSDASSLFLGNTAGYYDDGMSNKNTGIGLASLQRNTSGTNNTAIGVSSLRYNTTGLNNTATGVFSSRNNSTGSYNVVFGYSANSYNETGSNNTIIGYEAGRGDASHNNSGNIFLGYQAGYSETGSNKLYIENSNSDTPLIGGNFDDDEVYFNTLKLGIGTSNPRELLEVASPSGSYGRMIVTDGGGDLRNALLFVSPTSSNQTARIEAFNYGTGGGLTLNFNTTGNGNSIFGGNVLPENHISKNLGASGQAWNNVYAHNYVTQGSAAFANINVTNQLINYPPIEKQTGAFDEFTEKGLKELDPAFLPNALRDNNAILIDEMTTYNYKANYEQQLLIETLKEENVKLKARLDRLEKLLTNK